MYVLIHHNIKDSSAFWESAKRMEKGESTPPSGLTPLFFYPIKNDKNAFCLYKANSLDALQDFVDSELEEASENAYFPVDEEVAEGLLA